MRWTRYLLYPALLPIDIFVWLLIMPFIRFAWGKNLHWDDGVLLVELRPDSKPMQSWYRTWGGTTFGHGIMVAPDQAPATLIHERTHVRQLETAALAGVVLALCAVWQSPIAALLIWVLTPILVYVAGMVTALCYGLDAYRGNPAEEAAYDHAEVKTEGA